MTAILVHEPAGLHLEAVGTLRSMGLTQETNGTDAHKTSHPSINTEEDIEGSIIQDYWRALLRDEAVENLGVQRLSPIRVRITAKLLGNEPQE